MIADVVGINTVPENDSYVTETQDTLGRDQFLTMFLAQLKYQDPLNPMEGTEFSAQLAQFSSLEQLFNVNDNLESIKTLQDNSSRFQALDLIGKDVEADGDMLCLESGKTSQGSFTLDSAAECVVRVYGQEGYPVRDMDLGTFEAGSHTFEWDGRDRSGEILDPGVYGFEIMAVTADGESVPVQTRIKGQVTRVNLDDATPTLYVGDIPITLSQVLDIRIPEIDTGNEASS
jgi:flagellar basal-body rod modification protein FlgD